jgi:hypothetical protein
MIDALGAGWNHASDGLGSSLVFDASKLLQAKCTLYKAITEHKMVFSDLLGARDT